MKSDKKSIIGNLILLLTALIWGLAFSAQEKLAGYLAPFAVNGIRFIMGSVFLALLLPFTDRLTRNGRKTYSFSHGLPFDLTKAEVGFGLIVGVIVFLGANLQQFGLNDAETGPGKAAFLTALYIVIVPILGLFRKKKIGPLVILSVAVSVVGAYFLTMAGRESFTLRAPDLILLLCALVYSFHIFTVDAVADRVDGVRLSLVQFLTAAVLSVPFFFLFPLTNGGFSFGYALSQSVWSLLYLGVLSSGVGYTLQIIGQQMSQKPTVASLVMSTESVFGALGGLLIAGEKLSGFQWAGCAIILFAVVLAQLPGKKAEKTTEAE